MPQHEGKDVQDSGMVREAETFLKTVSTAMDKYETRSSQAKLLVACALNIENGGILMAEAGTGTGKTYAYLIPIIVSGKKAIVSTKTLNLQDQIVSKDLEFLKQLRGFSYAIAKGRTHYLCLRRFNAFDSDDKEDLIEHKKLGTWVSNTKTGDFEDFDRKISFIKDRICSDSDACKSKKCNYYGQCFYYRARRRWEDAQIIVANHSLVGVNGQLPIKAKILPHADVLITDEAHNLDQALSDVIGNTLSNVSFERILSRLLRVDENDKIKGTLSVSADILFPDFTELRSAMEAFWSTIRKEYKNKDTIKAAFEFSSLLSRLSDMIEALIDKIKTSQLGLFKEDDVLELTAEMKKLLAFSRGLKKFRGESDGYVRWVELDVKKTALHISPIYPADFIVKNIAPQYRSIICTSATLSVSGDFSITEQVLGLKSTEKITLASPFDLRNQVRFEVRKGIEPNNSHETAVKLAQVIVDEALKKDGGMLVLFTSGSLMKKTRALSFEKLVGIGLNPMMQGEMTSRVMANTMRASQNSVIFGLDSFWEGFDVKGDSLKCLIMTRLPFEVPTDPIVMARTEIIERRGGDPFTEYSLPRAILKFKQGVGRLIRSGTDTGRIIICDERIETKAYGRLFKNSLFSKND